MLATALVLLLCGCGSGATANKQPAAMSAAMTKALEQDDVNTLRKLLDSGESPDGIDAESGWSAIQTAAAADGGRCLHVLIDSGADVDRVGPNSTSALLTAIANGRSRNVAALVNAGADVEAGYGGMSPLAMAALIGKVEIAKLLLDGGAKPLSDGGLQGTPLHHAAASMAGHNSEMIALLLARLPEGAYVDVKNVRGDTPLVLAVTFADEKSVQLLLDAGADPNLVVYEGRTVLHQAAWGGSAEAISLLLTAGAQIDARDDSQRTPLYVAVAYSRPPMIQRLIESGADVNAKDDQGDTPLHLAARKSSPRQERELHIECVQILLSHGADKSIRNSNGSKPVDDASWLEVMELLKD